MFPTAYPDLNKVLSEFARSVQSILAENFVGAYLQGSFAVGDFDLHSDVDWIVVTEHELSDAHVTALQEMHERIYEMNSRWAKHLEGSYFPKDVVRTPAGRGVNLWYLDNGSRVMIQSDHCNTCVVRSVVCEHGIPLAGPAPETLIDPIDPDVLRQEIYTTMNTWGQYLLDHPDEYKNRFYQAYIVLNFSRMLYDLMRGKCGSKLAGAEWGVNHFDLKWAELIDRSWARRCNAANSIRLPADPDDYALTLDFLRFILAESQRYVPIPEKGRVSDPPLRSFKSAAA